MDNVASIERTQGEGGWTPARVELVKRTVVPKGIPDDEFSLFIEQCKRSGLDPLLKEAFCVGRRCNYGDKERPKWGTRYEFQPSEAGMLARAERFPDFKGIQAAAVFAEDEILVDQGAGVVTHRFNPAKRKGGLVGAWARLVRANHLPVVVWLDFAGYVQQTPLWSKIPTTMIEKCARVAALRKAYPAALGGLYVREEMPAEEFVDAAADVAALSPALLPEQQRVVEAAEAFCAANPPTSGRIEHRPEVERVTRHVGGTVEAVTPTAPAAVAFGPHKGMPVTNLTDDQLSETMAMAQEKLHEQPKAKWARTMRESLAVLEIEAERRFRGYAASGGEPPDVMEPGSNG